MKNVLFVLILAVIFIFGVTFAFAYVYHYYKIDLSYDDKSLKSKSVRVVPLSYRGDNTAGIYCAEIRDSNSALLNKSYFSLPLDIHFDTIDQSTGDINGGGVKHLKEAQVELYLPYFSNAKEINIYNDKKQKMLTIDVSMYSKK